jgi:hypothetical protein
MRGNGNRPSDNGKNGHTKKPAETPVAVQLSPAEEYERLLARHEPRQARFVREYLLEISTRRLRPTVPATPSPSISACSATASGRAPSNTYCSGHFSPCS